MSDFDYRFAVEKDIVRLGRTLVGLRLGDIRGATFNAKTPVKGKGETGIALERFFGIPSNSRSEADFPGAGIELKVVPLIRSGNTYRVKERTVIGMINYSELVKETWAGAQVRRKLAILFIYVEHLPGKPKKDFPIRRVLLWRPSEDQERTIQRDWETVRAKVSVGFAHELTESDGRLMGPCTKARDSSTSVPQPVTIFSPTAKPRAFALKPSFTLSLYRQETAPAETVESLMENLGIKDIDPLEARILNRFREFVGKPLGGIALELGVPLSDGKGFAGGLIRRLAGARSTRTRIKEFVETGVTTKGTRIDPTGLPYEAMSFPHFRYLELIEEDWNESTFLTQLDGLLIVPFRGQVRQTPAPDCRLGMPILWRPDAEETELAESEWTMFRNLVREGKAKELPGEASTEMIHVRPHARDGTDTLPAPVVGPVVKKSFWLNRRFVAKLLTRAT